MPWPSIGEKFPLVTSPAGSPSTSTACSARGGRRPSTARPRRRRATPCSRSATSGSRPRNPPGLSHATTQPRPAWRGVIPGPSSWPCSGRPASSRSVSRAPSPAGYGPGAEHRLPHDRRRVGRDGQLDAVLARVARAGHGADRARRPARCRRGTGRWPPPPARSWPGARGPTGPWTAMIARLAVTSSPPIAATTRSVLDALGMTSKTSSSSHHTMMSSSTDASDSSSRWVYWARPGAILPRSLVRAAWRRSSEPGALDSYRAEVAHVEGDGRLCGRPCARRCVPSG